MPQSNIYKELLKRDRRSIWHPYSAMPNTLPVFPVESATGVKLRLSDGTELIDGMSSWWCAIHGYNHPDLNHAVISQLEKMSHVMFGGLTHEPAIELAEQLITLSPPNLDAVFFSDSGSVAVEVAMKMATQFWAVSGKAEKHKFLTIRNGYHGDTFGAMSVCDPVTGMHNLFSGILAENLFAPQPQVRFSDTWESNDVMAIEELIKTHHREIAAVILEPVVQGAGGMWFYHPEYLKAVRQYCDQFDVLLITDEIATGFGRTGKFFACEHALISPDIMCVGKAMSGGYMSFAATMASRRVAEGVSRGAEIPLMHGPTFMANPLACSVSLANIKLLRSWDWKSKIDELEKQMERELFPCRDYADIVSDVRVLGGIGVVELIKPVNMLEITEKFIEQGVWIRPFGKLIYIMPPYVIKPEELSRLTSAIFEIVGSLSGQDNVPS
ncbi:MAG: adenosylmethionine--8-amino-7-oxononanoate transaminase [Gammaproteobacteria bacterium]|nr:adenosylmethionine--8-amino-7-oxononanoate transaminase [Gammaproteobacteria bacterium]